MTRANEKTPSPSASTSAGRSQKPTRPSAGAEAFGRFVGTLARLEGGSPGKGQSRSGKEGGR